MQPLVVETGELIYSSGRTRVFRHAGFVRKEYLGPDAGARLRREAETLERLAGIEGVVQPARGRPPAHTLDLHDAGAARLADICRRGPLDAQAALRIARRIATALPAVHAAGVIHRDVSPANIVVTEAGEATLIDFDLAGFRGQDEMPAAAGWIAGTLGYVAPEQTGRTARSVDQRADLYALGATFYEMVTGRPPFEARDPLQLVHDHLVREPEAPASLDARIPPGLSGIVMRLLAKVPGQRYQGAEGLLHDLARLQGELARGGDGLFELGERDFGARLAPPAHVIGRDAELAVLRSALKDACESSARTVLVEGVAGGGKSALIRELRPLVVASGGWFVQGKFDQYRKEGDAAGGMTQALRSLAGLLLALDAEELAAQRRSILARLGRSAALLSGVVPEFTLLLGEQPGAPDVDAQQAEWRLQQAIVDVLGAVASPARPIVVFLDDLQWAGAQALRAFGRVMEDPEPRGLLLVGAFRPRDGDGDLLTQMIARWRGRAEPPFMLALGHLGVRDVCLLAAQMLRLPVARCTGLGESLAALTGGNPFDAVELLNALRDDGVLMLDQHGWHWHDDAVRHFVGRSNVVDLLAARLARLPADARDGLQAMCCIGNAVDAGLLATVLGTDTDSLFAALAPALEDGLLVSEPDGGRRTVSFRHDRVQEAVRNDMDDAQRGRLQLKIARRLAAHEQWAAEAAEQYLACRGELLAGGDRQELARAARLFHGFAQRVATSADFLLAERHLFAAASLLSLLDDAADAALRREVDVRRHAALVSLGRFDESDALFAAIAAQAPDAMALVDAAGVQMRSLYGRGRSQDAKTLGLHLLEQLGLAPAQAQDDDLEARLQGLRDWLVRESGQHPSRREQVSEPVRKQMREPRLLAIARLLNRMARPSYLADHRTFLWMLLESQRLWAEHGPCPDIIASIGRGSAFLTVHRQDYRTAYELARHALCVGEAFGWEPQTSEARFLFATTAHWYEPLEATLEDALRAVEGIRAGGDAAFAAFAHIPVIGAVLDLSPTVEACLEETQGGVAAAERLGVVHAAAMETPQRQMMRALLMATRSPGSFEDAQFDEREFLQRAGHLAGIPGVLEECKAMHALVMGNADALIEHGIRGQSLMGHLAAYSMALNGYLFCGIAHAWRVRLGRCGEGGRAAALAEVESCRAWLEARAHDQPDNFLLSLRLLEAEQAWALGDRWAAARAFDAAAAASDQVHRPWRTAVVMERAGLFHLAEGLPRAGREFLERACGLYGRWGAIAKVAQMREAHPFLARASRPWLEAASLAAPALPQDSSGFSVDALDLMGVLRASQALSSETGVGPLTARVAQVLSAMSGATKVLVVTHDEVRGWMLASAAGEDPVALDEAAERGLLPLAVFRYAQRTRAELVIDDACTDDRFAADPYFAGMGACSLLVSPITSQGMTRAMLLLENRRGPAAFNAQRLEAVKLVAGQLAVSLANAQLYESLEERVQARTRELERAQAQLLDTARRAGKAEIAANVLHNVGNVLNSVNVSASLVRRTIAGPTLDGLGRVVTLLEAHGEDLPRFLAQEGRGVALLGYLRELDAALRKEQRATLDDVDRVLRSVDHISYVVATQQSHAGPSSVLERAKPKEMLEEALRLSAEALRRYDVAAVLRCDDGPATELDKPRLLQILVNLIANGARAMEGAPDGSRVLTIASGFVHDGGGERLRITVRDEGEGIAPEHLVDIFAHGFTTRSDGHGFGLHSSATAAVEMGGKLAAHSEGPGRGATFTLDVPVAARN